MDVWMLLINNLNSDQKCEMKLKINPALATQIEECRSWEEIGYNLENFFEVVALMSMQEEQEWCKLSKKEK
jgi:predicted hydrolase (HD superfamily)